MVWVLESVTKMDGDLLAVGRCPVGVAELDAREPLIALGEN